MENLTSRLLESFSRIGVEFLIARSRFSESAGWTHLKGDHRESDASCSIDGTTVGMTFWDKGHVCGTVSTQDLARFATICKLWFVDNLRLSEIRSRFSELKLDPVEPLLHGEVDALRDWTWNKLEQRLSQETGTLRLTCQLLVLAKNDPLLMSLFPYTSHDNLRFSDNSGYPFNPDLPYLSPIEDGRIFVDHGKTRTLSADPSDAVERLRMKMATHHLQPRIGL